MWWAAALLTPAVFLVPAGLVALRGYGGESDLVAAAESAFLRADVSAPVTDSRELAELTAMWREFHLVKALIAGLLVLALVSLASTVRRRVDASESRRRRALLLSVHGGVVVWLLGALTVLLANVQGAAAPFASVASLLPAGHGTGQLEVVLSHLRQAVAAGTPSSGGALASQLLGDFTLYHAVLAVLAAATGGVLSTLALRALWRRWRLRGPVRSPRPTWLVETTLYGAAGAVFLLLSLANASTWVHPVPALLASLGGS
ncbi:hypothetical protein GCM10025782_25980 [Pedococcus ginsenosidimutans]|uniref:Uncharacterized protein n=1 Tax=Pedococcus ginsenosidimutans TaxID=490570 RepID=A0ABP8YC88_9MICO